MHRAFANRAISDDHPISPISCPFLSVMLIRCSAPLESSTSNHVSLLFRDSAAVLAIELVRSVRRIARRILYLRYTPRTSSISLLLR